MGCVVWECVLLTTSTESMHFALIPMAAISLLSVIGSGPIAYGNPAFGRFETLSDSCKYQLAEGEQQPCKVIQLDRKSDAVVAVRFIGRGERQGSRRELTFVTITAKGAVPLTCTGGDCRLKKEPWLSTVSSVAEKNFDERGLSQGLPKAWPVRGECQLSSNHLSCRSKSFSGEVLRGEVHL